MTFERRALSYQVLGMDSPSDSMLSRSAFPAKAAPDGYNLRPTHMKFQASKVTITTHMRCQVVAEVVPELPPDVASWQQQGSEFSCFPLLHSNLRTDSSKMLGQSEL